MVSEGEAVGFLSHDAVEDGRLDSFGDRVFTDTRVRKALAESPDPFISAVQGELGHPLVSHDALHRSLVRVLDATASPVVGAPSPAAAPKKTPVGPPEPPRGHENDLEHHLANKSSLIRELWEAIDNYASSLGGDVTRRVRKRYIGYFRGKRSFVTTGIQKGRVLVFPSLTKTSAQPWLDQVMRDVSKIGHFGMGGVEYSLGSIDQLDEVCTLVSLAYVARSSR